MSNYEKCLYLGTTSNGKRIIKHIRAQSEKELKRKIRDAQNEYDLLGEKMFNKEYFGTWAKKWYEDKEIENKVSIGILTKNTAEIIKRNIKILNTKYENTELKKIKCSDFQKFLQEISEYQIVFDEGDSWHKELREKPASKSLIRKFIQTGHQIWRYAIANDVPCTDFFGSLEVPTLATENKREAISYEQIKWIINTPHTAQTAAMIMLFAGLRRSECLALNWDNIDFINGLIHVIQTYDIKERKIKDKGKTKDAIRDVPMPPILIDYLSKQKPQKASGYLFTTSSGELYSDSGFRHIWDSYMFNLNLKYGKKYNRHKNHPKGIPITIEEFTCHQLRHTYATMLFLTGVNQTEAMQYMGHSNIQTTINIYTDLKYNRLSISNEYRSFLINNFVIEKGPS